MAVRTPGLQPRSLYHAYWGQYAYAGGSGSDNLPNSSAAPLANPEFSKLEVGDTASATDGTVSNRSLWVCVDPGTVGGSNAQWRRCDNQTAATSVRDAHTFVVGYSPNGDVVGATCDYLETGGTNGSQIQAALTACGALVNQGDVRLRRMQVTISPAITVPANVHFTGAGRSSELITPASGSQNMMTLSAGCELDSMYINGLIPTGGTSGGGGYIDANADDVYIHDLYVFHGASATIAKSQRNAILVRNYSRVENCEFVGSGVFHQGAFGTPEFACIWANGTSTSPDRVVGRISDCTFTKVDSAILLFDTNSIVIERCDGSDISLAGVVIVGGVAAGPCSQISISDCRYTLVAGTNSSAGDQAGVFFIQLSGTSTSDIVLDSVTVKFQDPVPANRSIFRFFPIQGGNLIGTRISNCAVSSMGSQTATIALQMTGNCQQSLITGNDLSYCTAGQSISADGPGNEISHNRTAV